MKIKGSRVVQTMLGLQELTWNRWVKDTKASQLAMGIPITALMSSKKKVMDKMKRLLITQMRCPKQKWLIGMMTNIQMKL